MFQTKKLKHKHLLTTNKLNIDSDFTDEHDLCIWQKKIKSDLVP